MAALTTTSIDEVHALIMTLWSKVNLDTPVTKAQLRGLIVAIDTGLESAESSIVAGLPGGPGKTWLVANQPVGRRIMEETEQKRRMVL